MNSPTFEKMLKIKKEMLRNCKLCFGRGSTGGIDCECMKKFEKYVIYMFSGIEKEYWDLTLSDFNGDQIAKEAVAAYIKNIDNAVKNGLGLGLSGSHGTGKSMSAILILKAAVEAGYSIRFITLAELMKLIKSQFNENEEEAKTFYEDKVRNIELLVIDDIGEEYTPKDYGAFCVAEMSLLFRHRRRSCLPTIVTTNLTKADLELKYGSSMSSLMKSNFKFVTIAGEDYREKQGEKWEQLLNGDSK